MLTAVIVLLILAAVLLVLIVLVQDSKGGLASGNNASQIMGVKKTGDILEKLTWGFGIGIMVLCISTGFMVGSPEDGGTELPGSVNIEKAKNSRSAVTPTAPSPAPSATPDSGSKPATDTAKK